LLDLFENVTVGYSVLNIPCETRNNLLPLLFGNSVTHYHSNT